MGHSGDLRSGQPIKGALLIGEAAAAGHRLLHRRGLFRDELGSSTQAPSSVRSQPGRPRRLTQFPDGKLHIGRSAGLLTAGLMLQRTVPGRAVDQGGGPGVRECWQPVLHLCAVVTNMSYSAAATWSMKIATAQRRRPHGAGRSPIIDGSRRVTIR